MMPKFPLGRVFTTPGALAVINRAGQSVDFFLEKHSCGDWGELSAADEKANADALREGGRVMSSYRTLKGDIIWVATEFDRSLTAVMVPGEY